MQDMDEQEANAKLLLGTIASPNQMQDFFAKPNAPRTWMSRRQARKLVLGTIAFPNQMRAEHSQGNAKQMSKTIGLPNQILKFVFQTKYMQDVV
jgi:hypothetical protein